MLATGREECVWGVLGEFVSPESEGHMWTSSSYLDEKRVIRVPRKKREGPLQLNRRNTEVEGEARSMGLPRCPPAKRGGTPSERVLGAELSVGRHGHLWRVFNNRKKWNKTEHCSRKTTCCLYRYGHIQKDLKLQAEPDWTREKSRLPHHLRVM